jgi:hypothetical protein
VPRRSLTEERTLHKFTPNVSRDVDGMAVIGRTLSSLRGFRFADDEDDELEDFPDDSTEPPADEEIAEAEDDAEDALDDDNDSDDTDAPEADETAAEADAEPAEDLSAPALAAAMETIAGMQVELDTSNAEIARLTAVNAALLVQIPVTPEPEVDEEPEEDYSDGEYDSVDDALAAHEIKD